MDGWNYWELIAIQSTYWGLSRLKINHPVHPIMTDPQVKLFPICGLWSSQSQSGRISISQGRKRKHTCDVWCTCSDSCTSHTSFWLCPPSFVVFTVCEPVPVCVRVAQSAESHRLKELEQIKSHPASLAVTSQAWHSEPLCASFHLTGFKQSAHVRQDGTDSSHSY